MKCLAIADLFINKAMMDAGLNALRDKGIDVEVREWSHDSIEKLQEDNLRVEQEGAEAVTLPAALLEGADDVEILITQFAPVNKPRDLFLAHRTVPASPVVAALLGGSQAPPSSRHVKPFVR